MIAKIKKLIFSLILGSTLICFIPKQSANAEEAYVYCAADIDHWHWLSHKTVKVTGKWRIKKLSFSSHIKYFIIDGGFNAVFDLQNQCKREFGQNYKYAQPADNVLSGWNLFGVENGMIVDGIYDFSKHIPRIGK